MPVRPSTGKITGIVRATAAVALAATGATGLAVAASAPAHATGTGTGTMYYVSTSGSDGNSGTSASAPWASLAKVNAESAAGLFQPGDTIAFQGGQTWNVPAGSGAAGLLFTSSGAAGSPITVTSYGTGRAVLAGGDNAQSTVELSNVHDVTVANLEVTNSVSLTTSNANYYRGIYVQAKDSGQMPGITISDNYVHAIDGPGGSGGIGEGGIVVGVRGNTTPTWFANLQITGNEVASANAYGISTFTTWCGSCEIYSSETGVPSSEVSATRQAFTAPQFLNNYVHDVTDGGITPQYSDNALVQGNTVDRAATHRLTGTGGNVGIWWQGTNNILVQYNTVRDTAQNALYYNSDGMAFDADISSANSVVQYNYSDSNWGGFFMCILNSGNTIVRYNVSQNDHRRPFTAWSGCSNFRGYSNTIWTTTQAVTIHNSDGTTSPLAIEAMVRDQEPYNVALFDNVFYNPNHAVYAYSGDNTMDFGHNLYWDGSSASTVVPADESAPLVADPQLVNGGGAVPPDGVVTVAQLRQILAGYATQNTSPARNAGVSTSTAPQADLFGTSIPAGAVDLGASQHSVSVTATTSLGTSAGAIANVADGDPASSWASADSPALPGTVTLTYGEARPIDGVNVAVAFGQGQGPTNVDVQTWNGSAWVTQVSGASLAWHQNTASPEWLRIALPSTVTTTQVQLVVHSANETWGHLAIYEIRPTYGAVASSGMGVHSGNITGNLVDGNTATSWASLDNPALPAALQIDPGAPQTVSAVNLMVAFGQGQGPTSVSIEANPGGVWQQVLAATAITWSSNTSTVETRTLTLPAPVTATQFRVVIRGANLAWGHVALNEVTLS